MRSLNKWLGCSSLVAVGWFVGQVGPLVGADPQGSKNPPQPLTADDKSQVVAYVNGQAITRQDLGEELIARHGKHQLELLINRRIIQQAATAAAITVTDAEVEADLQEVMQLGKFRTPKEFEDHFLKKEKNCTLYEYKEDVVRPGLVMKKLAGKRIDISEDDLKKAYQAKFGEKVQCCIILEQDKKVALSMYGDIIRSEQGVVKAFFDAAKRQSNVQLAAGAGRIHPIGRNTTYDIVERRAFELKDNEISEVLEVPGGNLIMLRERLVPPEKDKSFAEERDALRLEIQERKMRAEVPKIFRELREQSVVQDFLNKKYTDGLIGVLEQNLKERGAAPKRN